MSQSEIDRNLEIAIACLDAELARRVEAALRDAQDIKYWQDKAFNMLADQRLVTADAPIEPEAA